MIEFICSSAHLEGKSLESTSGYCMSVIPNIPSESEYTNVKLQLGLPLLPTFCQIMCSESSMLLGLADYSSEKKGQKREGMKKNEKQGRRGSERHSSESSEANPVEEPPLQSDEHRCLVPSSSPSCLHCHFFPLLLASSPLFISALRVPSTRLQLLLLLQPFLRACWISCSHSLATASATFSFHPSIHPRAWRLRAGPFLLLRGRLSHH